MFMRIPEGLLEKIRTKALGYLNQDNELDIFIEDEAIILWILENYLEE